MYICILGNGKKECWLRARVRWYGEHSEFLVSSVALGWQFYFHGSIAEINNICIILIYLWVSSFFFLLYWRRNSLVSWRDEVINNNFFERIPMHCMNYSGRRLSNYSANRYFMIRVEKDQGNFTTCMNLTQTVPLDISFWLDF